MKEAQMKLLSKKVFNLDPNAQMVHLSCKIAQICQTRLGHVTEGFQDLTTGICNLLVSSMQNKLEMHYRYVNKGWGGGAVGARRSPIVLAQGTISFGRSSQIVCCIPHLIQTTLIFRHSVIIDDLSKN